MGFDDVFLNDTEFDEEGRPITKREDIKEESEIEFDEEGRPVIHKEHKIEFNKEEPVSNAENEGDESFGKEEENTEVDEKISNIKNVSINFCTIKEGSRSVDNISLWEMSNNDKGAFFVTGGDERILDHFIEVRDDNEELIWSSPIDKLPKNTFCFSGEKVHISSKALRDIDLPKGDGRYTALVTGNIFEGMFILTIQDNREENRDEFQDEVVEFNSEEFINKEDYKEEGCLGEDCKEERYEEEDSMKEEYKEEGYKEEGCMEEDCKEEGYKEEGCMEEDCKEEGYKEELVEEDCNEEGYAEDCMKEDCYKEELMAEECKEEINHKDIFLYKILEYIPTDISICAIEDKIYPSIRKNIVIEKLGDIYITILNNFAFRPVYLLTDNEQYTKWEGTLEQYIEKIKDILNKMYGLSEDEFNSMEKLLIVEDKEYEEYISKKYEQIHVVNRSEMLERLYKKHNIVVDLTEDECNIIYKMEDRILKVSSKGLAYSVLSELWAEKIMEILSEFKGKEILFIGLAAFENNYSKLKENFKMPEELSFVSLGRLID